MFISLSSMYFESLQRQLTNFYSLFRHIFQLGRLFHLWINCLGNQIVLHLSTSPDEISFRVKFEKINIWKSQHFMLKFKIISSYEQICTCSSWFSFLSKQTISRPKYFDHWKRSLKLYFFSICSFLKAHSWLGIFMLFSLVKC